MHFEKKNKKNSHCYWPIISNTRYYSLTEARKYSVFIFQFILKLFSYKHCAIFTSSSHHLHLNFLLFLFILFIKNTKFVVFTIYITYVCIWTVVFFLLMGGILCLFFVYFGTNLCKLKSMLIAQQNMVYVNVNAVFEYSFVCC